MVTSIGGVNVQIRADNTQFVRELRETERAAGRSGQAITREFGRMDVSAKSLSSSIKGAASSMLALSVALGAGAGIAGGIRTIADFSQAMSTLQAVTGATAAEIALLQAEAQRLGGSTRFSATQAAEGMIFLARAGFTAAEALQAVEGTLTLAQAGGLDLGRAADIASNVLGGFNLSVDQTARVVDVLAKAANSANVTVEGLGEALKFAAPTAAALGLSLEETVAIIGKLGDSGLQGGLGGRGFQSFATAFVGKKDEITALIGDFDLATDGLNNLIRRLVEAGITTQQVIDIFRAENVDVFTILANASQDAAKGTEVLTDKLTNAGGTAARVAQTMDDNLNGAILGAQSAFEALVLALGEAGADAALTTAIRGLADLLRFAAANADVLAVAVVALSARALIPLVASAVPAAITALRNLAGALLFVQGTAARTALVANVLGGPLTLAIAAAAAGYVALTRSVVSTDEALQSFNDNISKAKKAQEDIAAGVSDLEAAQKRLAEAIKAGGDAAEAAARAEVGAINERLQKNRELLGAYERQAAAALRAAEAGSRVERGNLARGLLGNTAGNDFFRQNQDPAQFEARIRGTIDGFNREYDAAIAAGRAITDKQRRTQALILDYENTRVAIDQAREALESYNGALTSPAVAAATEPTAPTKTTTEIDRDALALREQMVAIDLARAQGNEELARHLEEELAILQAQLEYQELGLDAVSALDAAISEVVTKRQAATQLAKEQAEADEAAARALAAYDEFNLRREERQKVSEEAAKAEEEMRQRIADGIAAGLEDGIRTGNWGEAFRSILANATSDALSEAINDLASVLVDLIGGALKGTDFGGLGSFFGGLFGGARAGGGSVRAGMRYMVGENGPEMFVPSVPGTVVPGFEGPPSAAGGAGFGVGAISISAPFIVQGSITEDVLPRVQAMMAAQARELPRVIDARVADSIRRNRY